MGYNNLQYLTLSNSSTANYIAWAGAISAQMAAIGWAQAPDTGQVVWSASVTAITAASLSGSNTTYTYTLSSGPVLRVGMSIVIASMGNAGNNGTFTITALGAGTFTVVNASGVNASSQSGTGTVAAIASVPSGSTTRDYEIWTPNDGLTNFYVRLYYGYSSTVPYMSVAIGAATNGAGTLSGFVMGTDLASNPFNGSNQTSTADCYFCGAPGRLSFLLGRSIATTSMSGSVIIERTKNSDGTDSSEGVYLNVQGFNFFDCVLVFGVGTSPFTLSAGTFAVSNFQTNIATLFNNSIALKPITPAYGKIGYPMTGKMAATSSEVTEGSFVVTSLYGAQRTYIVSGSGNMGANSNKVLMRFD